MASAPSPASVSPPGTYHLEAFEEVPGLQQRLRAPRPLQRRRHHAAPQPAVQPRDLRDVAEQALRLHLGAGGALGPAPGRARPPHQPAPPASPRPGPTPSRSCRASPGPRRTSHSSPDSCRFRRQHRNSCGGRGGCSGVVPALRPHPDPSSPLPLPSPPREAPTQSGTDGVHPKRKGAGPMAHPTWREALGDWPCSPAYTLLQWCPGSASKSQLRGRGLP